MTELVSFAQVVPLPLEVALVLLGGVVSFAAGALCGGYWSRVRAQTLRVPVDAKASETHTAPAPSSAALSTPVHAPASTEGGERYRFLARVAHELRTPVNAISGFAELLLEEEGSLSEAQRVYLRDIHESSHHLVAMVGDLLDLAKLEAGRLHVAKDPVRLDEALQAGVEMVRPLARKRQLSIERVDGGPVLCLGDARRLTQVVLNLLSNAIKFTPSGGGIVVAARTMQDFCELIVRDTGVGIDPSEHRAIFDEFHQGDAQRVDGAGIGLALVKQLVCAMDGSIEVDSQLGQGATFRVRFPAPVGSRATTGGVDDELMREAL